MAAALRVTTAERASDVGARSGRCATGSSRGCRARVPNLFVNGDPARKVAGNCHVGFPGVEAEALLVALDRAGVCAAAGSSCSSGATEPSHVLAAMGIAHDDALASVRLSLGFASTPADVERALDVIPAAVGRLRVAGARTAR